MALAGADDRRVVVIGAGVVGLAAAYHLLRLGCRRVTVLEQRAPGHLGGGSHGAARITRSAYADPLYVRLMRRLHTEEWPRLEADFGEQLVRPWPGCFFGPADGPFARWAEAVAEAGAVVMRLSPAEGRRRFPQFRFDSADGVLDDRTAGVLRAERAMSGLVRWIAVHGGQLRSGARVTAIEPTADHLRLVVGDGYLVADAVVVAAGAWVGRLIPGLARAVAVQRQTVGYYRTAEDFPCWVYVGREANEVYYGLPDDGRGALKVGRHETWGRDDDPDATEGPDLVALAEHAAVLKRELAEPVPPLVHAETCLYASTATEDFLIDRLPGEGRIVVGAACSGHGFKLAPLTGQLLADLALDRPSDPSLAEATARWRIGGAAIRAAPTN
jgi:sarcosine oxidase